jgi:protein-S-isoprenylcysteine O-methyltransferase Ste14
MTLTPPLALGFWNAWLLLWPMVVISGILTTRHKDLAKRLSDMTDYTRGEKLCTVVASVLPYPLVGIAVFTPLASMGGLLILGGLLSLVGSVGYFQTLWVFVTTPTHQTLQSGPYRLSRNPLYVSAALIFLGTCLATGSLILAGILAVMLVFQHFMILAEERACQEKYGAAYVAYAQRTARYLGRRRG